MPKITFMGAGSTVFAKNVLGDSMVTPALAESTIALYDIDPQRLEESYLMLHGHQPQPRHQGQDREVSAASRTARRRCAARTTSSTPSRSAGYGVPVPSRTSRCRRSTACARPSPTRWASAACSAPCAPFPVMLDFAQDMEEVCPDAWLLNYTNPMAMLTGAMQRYDRRQARGPVPQRAGLRVHAAQASGHAL